MKTTTTKKPKAPVKNKVKPYPIIDGKRKHYVRHAIQITEYAAEFLSDFGIKKGEWMAVDVLDTGGYQYLLAPNSFKDQTTCQKACDTHNKFLGFKKYEADDIISKSMGL